jgi:serine-type D-Ala-D-Ala carboxypeptidase/endopeptidase (penicillin-binding protein 4)
MMTYATGAALAAYGPGYRFRTPVYRQGLLRRGVLGGDLILVASGDFSMGLRDRKDGTLGFNSLPEVDHNDAGTGPAGPALVPGSDPLAGLDRLARTVRAAGVRVAMVRDVPMASPSAAELHEIDEDLIDEDLAAIEAAIQQAY